MYLIDYHMHSNFSLDGKNSIDELCNIAIKRRLSEIAISDHYEPTKANPRYKNYRKNEIISEIKKAKDKYKNRLKIKMGIEVGQPYRFPQSVSNILDDGKYDFVLASAHKDEDDIDLSEFDYLNINIAQCCKNYLSEVERIVDWGNFDCLAHFDLIKRYAANYGIKVHLIEYRERIEKIFKKLILKGKGIEINTSGLRQNCKTCMPDIDILSIYKNLGGEILTIGSDAHYREDVGKGIFEGLEIAKLAGFSYITTFEDRKPSFIKISNNKKYYIKTKDTKGIA